MDGAMGIFDGGVVVIFTVIALCGTGDKLMIVWEYVREVSLTAMINRASGFVVPRELTSKYNSSSSILALDWGNMYECYVIK